MVLLLWFDFSYNQALTRCLTLVSSKAYDSTSLDHVETFGFRGEGVFSSSYLEIQRPIATCTSLFFTALASISDLSSVEISSKARWGRETWTAILKVRNTLQSAALRLIHPTLRMGRGFILVQLRLIGASILGLWS